MSKHSHVEGQHRPHASDFEDTGPVPVVTPEGPGEPNTRGKPLTARPAGLVTEHVYDGRLVKAAPRSYAPMWKTLWTALLVVAAAGAIVYVAVDSNGASGATPAASTTAPTTAVVPVDPLAAEQGLRASSLALQAAEAGLEPVYGAPENVPALANQVCALIDADPAEAGVWAAAGFLEDGPFEFTDDQAWLFVDLATDAYCIRHHALVAVTIAEASS